MLRRVIAVEPLFSASDAGSPESALEGAHFASPEQGAVILSGNDVRVTNDGGKSWGKPGEVDWILEESVSRFTQAATDDHPTFIEVTDKEQTGMSCVTSTFFLDERNGWFSRDVIPDVDTEVGDEPGYSDIGKTEDRGKNWRVVSTLPGVRIFDLVFVNKDTGFIVGELEDERGVLMWTEDDCDSWSFILGRVNTS